MSIKDIITTLAITLMLSFFLQGINDVNTFIFSQWRQNTYVNLLHLWGTFATTYFLFSFIVRVGFKKFNVDSSKNLIRLLALAQTLTFLWVVLTDIAFYLLYYNVSTLSETTFYEFDIPIAIVILTIGSVHFYHKSKLNTDREGVSGTKNELQLERKLEVFKGAKSIFINHSDIGVFHLIDKIVWAATLEKESFQTNISLSQLAEELSPSSFFRLNRQVIVSRKIVKGYSKLDYQKLEVMIEEGFPSGVNLVISKYNAPAFKRWLTNSR